MTDYDTFRSELRKRMTDIISKFIRKDMVFESIENITVDKTTEKWNIKFNNGEAVQILIKKTSEPVV